MSRIDVGRRHLKQSTEIGLRVNPVFNYFGWARTGVVANVLRLVRLAFAVLVSHGLAPKIVSAIVWIACVPAIVRGSILAWTAQEPTGRI